MNRHSILAGFVVLLGTGIAAAEPFGKAGQVAVGVGPFLTIEQRKVNLTLDTPAGDYEGEQTETRIGLLYPEHGPRS